MNDESDRGESPLKPLFQAITGEETSPIATIHDLEKQLETFVRDRPVTAVLAALGVGFVVARLFSRR